MTLPRPRFRSLRVAGRSIAVLDVTLAESEARSSDDSGESLDLGDKGTLCLDLTVTALSGGTDEVQSLAVTSASGGTFTLTYAGQTTAAIAYNAAASAVQSALEALSNIEVGDVVCAGGALGSAPVTITFGGSLDGLNVAQITATSSLTGGGAAVAVTTSTPGVPPTLDVTLQTSKDDTNWRTLGTFAQISAAGSERKSFPGCDRYVRATWDLGGTSASFTFSIAGDAKLSENNPMPEMLARLIPRRESGTGDAVDLGSWRHRVMPIDVKVSGISGTGASLVVSLQTSGDGVVWTDLGDPLAEITSTGTYALLTPKVERFARVVWTIAGTSPVITWQALGYAVSSYCDPIKLSQLGLSEDELRAMPPERIASALRAASSFADSYLDKKYILPLITWDDALELAVAQVAAWTLKRVDGFNPMAGASNIYRDGYKDAVAWLEDAQINGSPGIVGTVVTSSPTGPNAIASFASDCPRGW